VFGREVIQSSALLARNLGGGPRGRRAGPAYKIYIVFQSNHGRANASKTDDYTDQEKKEAKYVGK